MGERQMGQRFVSGAVGEVGEEESPFEGARDGSGTVRIGSPVEAEMGGCGTFPESLAGFSSRRGFSSTAALCMSDDFLADAGGRTGGGSSAVSAAFRLSCLAKSLWCHHSKNLRANILVGKSILRLLSSLEPINLGFSKLRVSPGLIPGLGFGWLAIAMALWSASPILLILVPMSHKNGW